MDYRDSSWMAVMLEIMGEAEGIAFMKKLAAKDLYMRREQESLDPVTRRRRVSRAREYLIWKLSQRFKKPARPSSGCRRSDSRLPPICSASTRTRAIPMRRSFRRFFCYLAKGKA